VAVHDHFVCVCQRRANSCSARDRRSGIRPPRTRDPGLFFSFRARADWRMFRQVLLCPYGWVWWEDHRECFYSFRAICWRGHIPAGVLWDDDCMYTAHRFSNLASGNPQLPLFFDFQGWVRGGGSNFFTPQPWPKVGSVVERSRSVPWLYAMNVCTHSYTLVWQLSAILPVLLTSTDNRYCVPKSQSMKRFTFVPQRLARLGSIY
jgi:hypothetical protein